MTFASRSTIATGLLCLVAIACKSADEPLVIPTGTLTFSSVATRIAHTCGLTPTGAAYCWGSNSSLGATTTTGALGDGTTTDRDLPTAVSGGLSFTSIAAGRSTTCGLVADGSAYCWGLNNEGQYGDSTTTSRLVPTPGGVGHKFSSIAFSDGTTLPPYEVCGLDLIGHVFCWGRGNATPTFVATAFSFTALSVGIGGSFCGIVAGGDAYCWGYDPFGQLGTGSGALSQIFNPTPARVVGGHAFKSISVGFTHACGIAIDSQMWCWGDDASGQLGDGTFGSASTVPILVQGGHLFATVSADYDGTCGVTTAGDGYCWGNSVRLNLGVGGTQAVVLTLPRAVAGRLTFASISTGFLNSCGVTTANVAYCWGQGGAMLGIGPDGARLQIADSPLKVGLQP